MFFCHYSVFPREEKRWVQLVCWGNTPDDAYRGLLVEAARYDLVPEPEFCHFGKRICIEVETHTVFVVVEAE